MKPQNTKFSMTGGQFTTCAILIAIGIIATIWGFLTTGDEFYGYTRMWTNVLHNTVFFLGLGFAALLVMCAHTLGYSGWHTSFKRLWEAIYLFMPIGLIFLTILGVFVMMGWAGADQMYLWADEEIVKDDILIQGKEFLLNKKAYLFGSLAVVGVWILISWALRGLSISEDANGGVSYYKKSKAWSAAFLPIGGFSSVAMISLWVMSVEPHWYSTMFFWYSTVSWVVAMVAMTIMLTIYLKSIGHLEWVTKEHLHDLGKYLFGFSIFWTYLWFSQFMLIWYANVGEETVYFHTRMNHFPVIFYMNLVINFALPLLILVANSTKRMYGVMLFMSALIFFGHWLDFFQMIKPGVWKEVQHAHHVKHAHHGHDDHHGEETLHKDAHDTHHGDAHKEDAHHGEEAHGHDDHGHGHHGADNKDEKRFQLGFHFPGIIEFGMFAGFLGVFLLSVLMSLGQASLLPKNDPYIDESLHHEVMQGEGEHH